MIVSCISACAIVVAAHVMPGPRPAETTRASVHPWYEYDYDGTTVSLSLTHTQMHL